jgi:endonuclease/exonuclease/phosphatase family metal-dependent hydrolase
MGDLNAEPDSPELKSLVARTDLRLVPLGETFPSWKPKKGLDHFLVSPDILVNTASVLDIGLSDHLPIMMDLDIQALSDGD